MMDDLKELYLKLRSIRKVCDKTNLPLSTVWYQLNKFNILKKQKRINQLKIKDDLLIGTYIGLWAGDGSRFYRKGYNSKIHFHKKNNALFYFMQRVIKNLFDKKVKKNKDGENRASVRMFSKFIFDFPARYLEFKKNKTKTIRLRKKEFSNKFLRGFFLGLMLSDGHLNQRLVFVSISKRLAIQFYNILKEMDLNPNQYVHKRKKYGWNDLYMIKLNKKESEITRNKLNEILKELKTKQSFSQLKGYNK